MSQIPPNNIRILSLTSLRALYLGSLTYGAVVFHRQRISRGTKDVEHQKSEDLNSAGAHNYPSSKELGCNGMHEVAGDQLVFHKDDHATFSHQSDSTAVASPQSSTGAMSELGTKPPVQEIGPGPDRYQRSGPNRLHELAEDKEIPELSSR